VLLKSVTPEGARREGKSAEKQSFPTRTSFGTIPPPSAKPMNLESSLKDDVFRPLATTIVPGTLAIAPHVLIAAIYVPKIAQFWHDYSNFFAAIIGIATIAAGLICEDIGSEIEAKCIDGRMKRNDPEFETRWKNYLGLTLADNLVAKRYLKGLILRFKFELAMIPALTSLLVGLNWLNIIHSYLRWVHLFSLDAAILIGISLLCYEASQGAKVLDGLRADILAAYIAPKNPAP
jgi:hypothetical protein